MIHTTTLWARPRARKHDTLEPGRIPAAGPEADQCRARARAGAAQSCRLSGHTESCWPAPSLPTGADTRGSPPRAAERPGVPSRRGMGGVRQRWDGMRRLLLPAGLLRRFFRAWRVGGGRGVLVLDAKPLKDSPCSTTCSWCRSCTSLRSICSRGRCRTTRSQCTCAGRRCRRCTTTRSRSPS